MSRLGKRATTLGALLLLVLTGFISHLLWSERADCWSNRTRPSLRPCAQATTFSKGREGRAVCCSAPRVH
jgi:hypothetical protein